MKATFRKSFTRNLKSIKDRNLLELIAAAIEQVEAAASLQEVEDLKKLSGTASCYRIRVGKFRIGITLVRDTVDFVRCLPRRDMYRFFP